MNTELKNKIFADINSKRAEKIKDARKALVKVVSDESFLRRARPARDFYSSKLLARVYSKELPGCDLRIIGDELRKLAAGFRTGAYIDFHSADDEEWVEFAVPTAELALCNPKAKFTERPSAGVQTISDWQADGVDYALLFYTAILNSYPKKAKSA